MRSRGFYKSLICAKNLCSKGLGCLLLLVPVSGYSGGFCLLLAENYYEQLYCEVKAQGKGKRLPSFYDFQKNNEVTQAFLLKRPAAKLGIEVVQPKRTSKLERIPKSEQPNRSYSHADTVQTVAPIEGMSRDNTLAQCVFKSREILCAGVRYQLMGNLANKKLVQGVLERSNRMNIPVYLGEPGDKAALGRYLSHAYGQYVEKMLEIGLGGSTFSYAKFVYLYQDVTNKNIDFSGRFETMFGYLKQDKQQLAVSEKLPKNVHVSKEYCGWSGEKTVVCDGGQKNYLYRRQH
jgi:hypothetical protein